MEARRIHIPQVKLADSEMPPRRAYEKPKLEVLGDVRTITLGGSLPGGPESGTNKKQSTPFR
jgi:hypothetical protein